MSKPKLRPQGQTPSASPFLKSNNVKDPGEPVTRPPSTERRSGPKPRSPACPTGRTVIPARPSGRPPQRWRASRARRSPCQPRRRTRRSEPDPEASIGQKQTIARQTRRPIADPVRRCLSARSTSAAGADEQGYTHTNPGRQHRPEHFRGAVRIDPPPLSVRGREFPRGTRCVERCGASISTSCPPR